MQLDMPNSMLICIAKNDKIEPLQNRNIKVKNKYVINNNHKQIKRQTLLPSSVADSRQTYH